jgi:hypothetical protein
VELVIQHPQPQDQQDQQQQQQQQQQVGGTHPRAAGATASTTTPPLSRLPPSQRNLLGSSLATPHGDAGVVGSAPVLQTALVHLPPASAAADTNAAARLSMVSFSVSRRSLAGPLAPGAAVAAPGATVHILGQTPRKSAAGVVGGEGDGDGGSPGHKSVYVEEHSSTMVDMQVHTHSSQQQEGSTSCALQHSSPSLSHHQHQQQPQQQQQQEGGLSPGHPRQGSSSGGALGDVPDVTGDRSSEWQSPREYSTTG